MKGRTMKITAIRKVEKPLRVYNIETKKNHNYFAGSGLLVHNCFAYYQKSWNPTSQTAAVNNPNNISLSAINVRDMIQAMEGKSKSKRNQLFYDHFYSRKFLLHWGGLADPFCTFERENGVTLELIKYLGETNYPTLFSFKGDTVLDDAYLKVFDKYAKQGNFAFQVSIITADEKMARKVEVGVPSPARRLECLKTLHDMGYWTILRLRPFIIGISDLTLTETLERALEAGINGISTEFMAVDCRCAGGMKERYKWLGEIIGVSDFMDYFYRLSPMERGTYRRLNRLVKEPYVKEIYQFCLKNHLTLGVSDPDYKELCTSGSCCGMPDNFPKNRLMENWSRDQLTYHLKEARRGFHRDGEQRILRFHDIYNDKQSPYLGEQGYGNEYVGVIGKNYTERQLITLKTMMQEHWNNINSPNSPQNYLNGKVRAFGIDQDFNRLYRYMETDYEKRWKEEGISLTL